MSQNNDFTKQEDDSADEAGGRGGTRGQVEVRIATFAGDSRNEPRTATERRRFAQLHEVTQMDRVRRARDKQKALAALKEKGPVSLNQRQAYAPSGGGEGHSSSAYKSHPISQTAYFSGADESPVPGENRPSDVNEADREKLQDRPENKLRNTLSMRNAPKYTTPKPRPY